MSGTEPRVPVCLVLVYVVSEVLNQYTMTSLITSLRIRMEGSGLNLLNFKYFTVVPKYLTHKFCALFRLGDLR